MVSRATKIIFVSLALLALLALLVLAIWYLLWPEQSRYPKPIHLKILTYSSFVSPWGAGPKLAQKFENDFGIPVEFINGGDAALLIQKIFVPMGPESIDIVIGLDQLILTEAKKAVRWRRLGPQFKSIQWSRANIRPEFDNFVPFNWSPMGFIYRQSEIKPPQSLDDLLDSRFERAIALEDPRTSTPGFQFLSWVFSLKGRTEGIDYLKKLKPQLFTVAPSWSTAYGLFKKAHAKLVYSYLTSAVYHWNEEVNDNYQPAYFDHPHNYQIEYAGVLEDCNHCQEAEKFLEFLLSPQGQEILMKYNYMLPANQKVKLIPGFSDLHEVQLLSPTVTSEWMGSRKQMLKEWSQLF